jgi:hypothetical protein
MMTAPRYLLLFLIVFAVQPLAGQVRITTPAEGFMTALTNQAVVGEAFPNMPVTLDINGVKADSATVRVDGKFEFLGVRCPRGPVTFAVTVFLKNGRTFKAQRTIHIFGDPDSIVVELPSKVIPADSQSTLQVIASVLDRWKVKIPSGYFLTIDPSRLEIVEEDVDPNTPGRQFRLENGNVKFTLRATNYVGPVPVLLSTNTVSAKVQVYCETPRVPFMLVGSADGTVRNLSTTGGSDDLPPSSEFTKGVHKQGRIAAVGRGNVFGNYLLTLSIDTDRKLQDRIYRDLDPNSLYSMYGDNSIVTYEAQSTSPLFVKLEKNQSYALYGDFNTQLTKNEFSAYNRSFTGGKVHLQNEAGALDVFATVTNRKVVQEELRGQGISGYYFLRNNNLVTGSEKVRIEVRNKDRSEVVISSKPKSRYSDYEIDYVQGSLYFKQPVPSLDDNGNPVYIVVAFEAITNERDNLVAGWGGEVSFFDALTLGATSVVENREPKNYVLLGGNAELRLSDVATLSGEVARSADVTTTGNAWKTELELAPIKAISLRPYYRRVDGTFVNATQSGSGREVGTKKYGGTAQLEPFAGTTLSGELLNQFQEQGTFSTEIHSLAGAVHQRFGGNEVLVKVEDVKYNGENPEAPTQNLTTHSTLLTSRAKAQIVDGLSANTEYEHNLRKSEKDIRPDAVAIGLEYEVSKSVSVYGQQRFLQGQGQLTSVGVNTRITDETSAYGRYEIGNSISGERNAATVGLKNSLKLTRDLTSNFLYEKTKNMSKRLADARTDDHDAVSLSLEYLPIFPLKATVKGEYSEDANNLRKGFDFGLSSRVFGDFSIVTKATYYLAQSRAQTGYTKQGDYLFGFAYRPTAVNWLNMIGKLEHKVQDNSVVQPYDYYRATIASAHAYVEPLAAFEIGMKYALKDAVQIVGADRFSTISDFILVRPQYDLTTWLNIAGEARFLRQRGANDLKVGYSGEVGVVFVKNTMVSLGYNFQAYKDRDLVEYIYSVAGPYVTLRMKFTEELFGLGSRPSAAGQ